MIIITISKRKLKIAAAAVLAVILVCVGILQVFSNQRTEKFKELVLSLRQIDTEVQEEILTATSPAPEASNEVQIFDVAKGRIVKKMKTCEGIQRQAEKIVNSMSGLYVKVQPLPEKGYIVKIPFNPPVMVQNPYINAMVDKIFLIFTEKEPPFLLILDEKDRPFAYNFSAKTDDLMKYLNFKFDYQ